MSPIEAACVVVAEDKATLHADRLWLELKLVVSRWRDAYRGKHNQPSLYVYKDMYAPSI